MALKELIFNIFYFGRVVIIKELIFNIFYFGVCLERTDVNSFYCWEGVVVLKVLNFNSFYFCRCVVALK